MNIPVVDLSDDRSFANGFPHDTFTWLRAHDPVHWHEPTAVTPDGEGFWVVSRYQDVNTIIMDPKTYSSDKAGGRAGGGTAIKDEISAGKVLNQTDDPHHRRLRELVNKGFTVKAVAALEHELRLRAKRLIADVELGETFNFAQRIAREIPTQAICILLGVAQEDRFELCDWIDRGIAATSVHVIAPAYLRKLHRYAERLIDEKRAHPTDDIFSAIVHAQFAVDGSTLSDFELRSFFALLFPAGAETTTRAISGGMLAFLEHPQQWQRLRSDPTLIKTTVEEIVRWVTPSLYKRRTATRDVQLNGKTIHTGDKVTVWEMSANRDDRVFERPFDFDITRTPNKHLGFGAGVHFCLGAALARLELTIVFEALLGRGLEFELVAKPVWLPNNRLFGLATLPVKVARID
ncbi:MAG: cytochrome P450 [Proteobacteria bacterium]|nr:MAG: cytochrome P450 [Pseudomonadota bacterium]